MVFLNTIRRLIIAKKLDPSELVFFKELLMANSIQIDALCQLLIEKGLMAENEYFTKLQYFQAEYRARQSDQ